MTGVSGGARHGTAVRRGDRPQVRGVGAVVAGPDPRHPSECDDLAAAHPEKVRELVERWWVEAGRYDVLPLDNRPISAWVTDRPMSVPARRRYTYYPGAAQVPEVVAPNVRNRPHTVTADVVLPGEGTLIAQGSGLGGWSLAVTGGRLAYVHNLGGIAECSVVSALPVPAGRHELAFRFEPSGEHRGTGRLLVDGNEVASAEIPRFTPGRFSLTGAGVTCG